MSRPGLRAWLERTLARAWQARGALAALLLPLAWLYGALAGLRRWLYQKNVLRSRRLPVPVVVVGNVVAGGAGKTPVTLAVVAHLQSRGWQPGIVSRGHARQSRGCQAVAPDSAAEQVGDEPLLLRRRAAVPVFVAARRFDAARALLAAHPLCDIIVCDDGLQHLALARDVEICVFDARGIGNGWLLPAGPLRETWPRRTAADDLLLCTDGQPPEVAPRAASGLWVARRHLARRAVRADGTQIALTELRGQPLKALAGIARPQAFFDMLRDAGLTLAEQHALPDHHPFADWPNNPPSDGMGLICTEKDAVKLWRRAPGAWAVPLALDVPAAFFTALDERLAARGYHAPTPVK
ncbi:MAG: tetraacyldisaccharide 4'-kinase [Burkholderiaceae bacterium]|jgi:tetraacyldisaccharide 4'-kinase|nr:tetraacyldisaccharide 4'-kinase [Burkholderiaceae bacterium]